MEAINWGFWGSVIFECALFLILGIFVIRLLISNFEKYESEKFKKLYFIIKLNLIFWLMVIAKENSKYFEDIAFFGFLIAAFLQHWGYYELKDKPEESEFNLRRAKYFSFLLVFLGMWIASVWANHARKFVGTGRWYEIGLLTIIFFTVLIPYINYRRQKELISSKENTV